jgi:ATP-dependent Clp protease ATP-binding subunit ClpA
VFERFTERARQAVVLAQEEARTLGHDQIGTEHLLLGLLREEELFAQEAIAYVVAADRRWLCQCFATEYEDFKDAINTPGRPLGFLFLEKTFQISMEIPPMSFQARKLYWDKLTSVAPTSSARQTNAPDPSLSKAFALVRTEQDVEQQIDALVKAGANEEEVRRAAVRRLNAPALQEHLKGLLGEFAPLLENNPRAMKRLVNAYGIERDRLVRENHLPSLEERKQLVLFTILRLRWPLFAEHLLQHPEDVALLNGAPHATRSNHPFATLLEDDEVRALFAGSFVHVKLDADLFRLYSGREPEQPPSVGV